MAVAKRRWTQKPPPWDAIDRKKVRVEYEPDEDTLFVNPTGTPRPAINAYVDDDTMVRLDPVTEEVVGFEIENFLDLLLAKAKADASRP